MVHFKESAKVYSITGRKCDTALNIAETSYMEVFEYVFEKEAHQKIIMEDNISLYTVTKSEAVYVDCGDVDVFGDTIYPFTYLAQFNAAKRLIILPIEAFHETAKTIEVLDIPMCFLFHHGRCGSTLVAKLFAEIPDTFVVCDTKSFFNIAKMSSKKEATEIELKQLLKSVFLNYVKHANVRGSKLFFTKQSSTCTFIADLMMDVFPSVKYTFMYRQPIPYIESIQKLTGVYEIKDSSFFGCVYNAHKLMSDIPPFSLDEVKSLSLFSQIGWRWINLVTAYNNLIRKGYEIKSIKYEDLLSNPKNTMSSLASYLNVCLPLEIDFENVLAKDAQKGTECTTRGIPVDQLKKYITPWTNEMRKELNEVCDYFNVPQFEVDVKLSNPL